MVARRKILIVEDEAHIVELLAMSLRQNGFDHCSAVDGPGALDLARKERPDLVLLDLMLPGMSGLEVCRLLRQDAATSSVPIIMLTAKSEEADKVIGLGIGADDYVTKPFGLRELVARIEAALRRAAPRASVFPGPAMAEPAPAPPEVLKAGDLVIDVSGWNASKSGRRLTLSPTEFTLLATLARNSGRAVRRLELARRAGLSDDSGRSLDVHMRHLRAKLGEGTASIATIRGVGYRLDG